MATAPIKATVAPAPAPEVAKPSVVVQTERKLEFMKEPEAKVATPPSKIPARTLAEHAAGAEALANYQ